MRKLKLAVVLLFGLISIAGFGNRLFSPTVTGQSGGGALSAPTGVNASDAAYNNKVGVMWDAIRGANLYRVFRSTTNDSASASVIGTTSAATFYDTTALANQTYFYWIKAENGTAASAFSAADSGVRAVGSDTPGAFSPLQPPTAPAGNPVTATKTYLGKTLFWDEQLSATRTVSCGTCHLPQAGGSDPRSLANTLRSTNPGFDNTFNTPDDVIGSPGVPVNNADGTYSLSNLYGFAEQVTTRRSNAFLDAAYAPEIFWDGRARGTFRNPITNEIVIQNGAALESQILIPPVSGVEMGHQSSNWTLLAQQIAESKPLALAPAMPAALGTWINRRTYPELFQEAFGTPEVTPVRIAMAIATYERTLFSDQTPLDKSIAQIEPLTQTEERGKQLFINLQCNTCHDGSLLSDNQFHNIGVRPAGEDAGRFAVSNDSFDQGSFKTPGLRNVQLRAPYMHNGKFNSLIEVVEFYNRGGDFDAPNVDHGVIRPLELSSQEKSDLVAFMGRPLTDPRVAAGLPPFDRPTLYAESNRVPQLIGTGRAGSNGIVPKVTAIEPPLAGNQSFTVGVSTALGSANAVLVIDTTDPGVGAAIPAGGAFARRQITLNGAGAGGGSGSVSLAVPSNAAIIGQTFFGRWYVSDPQAANGFSVSQAFRFTVFGEAAAARRTRGDFDGDGKTDVAVFRSNGGNWYISNSANASVSATNFGAAGDTVVAGDYDGDGKSDVAVFRSGNWYIMQSSAGFTGVSFGASGDVPQPNDYDGDGKTDIAVFRPSTGGWYILRSRDGFLGLSFGQSGDKAVSADYDGDGKADAAVYRSGNWYILQSGAGFRGVGFGTAEDKPVVGDYDGDGKSDIALFRPSTGSWYYLRSSDNSFVGVGFGVSTDRPVPGDYDGDGKSDIGVFRPSTGDWYILQSGNGAFRGQNFGNNQDFPVPASVVP